MGLARVSLGLSCAAALAMAVGCGLSSAGTADGGASVDASTDATVDDANTADAPTTDSGDAAPPPPDGGDGGCPTTLRGPALVQASDFCIDSTEVTKGQYAKFLAALGDGGLGDGGAPDGGGALSIPPECNYKKVVADVVPSTWDPTTNLQRPVTFVDWCDAALYCRWTGKHICGKRAAGGAVDWNEASNSPKNQWYVACSQDGLRTWSYGANWDPTKCRVDDNGQKPADVGSYGQCVGGYPGLFDMTGNVGEWIDQCDGPGRGDSCKIVGGDYGTNDDDSRCDARQDRHRDNASNDWVGFRCCY